MLIRPVKPSDAPAIAALLPELGYPATEGDVAARLVALDGLPGHALFVAVADGDVAGLCQIQSIPNIAGDGYAEIHALVVAQKHRRKGIGSALVGHGVAWASAGGHHRVRLRSGVHREDAHKFYESVGFTRARASFAFETNRDPLDRE